MNEPNMPNYAKTMVIVSTLLGGLCLVAAVATTNLDYRIGDCVCLMPCFLLWSIGMSEEIIDGVAAKLDDEL